MSNLFNTVLTLPAPPTPNPSAPSICASDLPLVLLPVRLETRFFTLAGGTVELRVRIYPDTIHLDSHETDLLSAERDAGMAYWDSEWRTGNDANNRAATMPTAWSRLADQFGAERAAFIVRSLTPTNPQDRPTAVVPAGTALSPAIVFPTVTLAPANANAWRTAPKAKLLPDRWTAVVTSGMTTLQATGNPIPRPLAVGPDPQVTIAAPPPDQIAIDPGMKWMVDFTEAEAKGMGLRIALPASVVTSGIDSLVVFGVSALSGADGAAQLASLLDAHHYTDGLDFLRFGTPTNNTDDRRAPQIADDPGHARSYALEVAADPSTFAAGSNATRLGAALGLGAQSVAPVLGHIGQASDQHETMMQSMNSALWQVGWGNFLTNMVGFNGTGLTPALVDWARDYFVSFVRAGGPLPVLRAGHQPYGILPVTSLDLWKPKTGQEQALAPDTWIQQILIKLREFAWRQNLGTSAFRLGRRGNSVDADLADVMRTDGISSAYSARSVFGGQYFQHLEAFLAQDISGAFSNAESSLTAPLLSNLGLTWRPRAASSVAAELSWPIKVPLIQAGEVSPWKNLEPNYISSILSLKTASLLAPVDPNGPNAPKSLLEALLRHAHGREVATATAKLAVKSPNPPSLDLPNLLHDAEMIDLVFDAPLPEPWRRQIQRQAPGQPAGTSIAAFIDGLPSNATTEVAALGDFRSSLAFLQGLDSETLQYSMQATLDLSNHRIDAWITSFATKRLAAMRNDTREGVYVGSYGWVENLRMAPASSATPVTTLPANEPGPLVAAASDSGFIHAPSITHASAAAVLRNAHLGPSGKPDGSSPFAIDLSSRRVREADRLLDGLRTGQPLGALLGYRIERALHDLSLDSAVPALRKIAPLTPAQSPDANTPTEAIAANNVVDGLTLAQQWSAGSADDKTAITSALTTAVGSASVAKATNELDALTDLVDALSDALTAEAAYQIARGNTSRTAATLSSIAKGEAPPPELEVARTPRTGTSLTHRVIVLQAGNSNLSTAAWPAWNTGTLSSLEPMLNSWVARLLGDPAKTRCAVERLDASGSVVETKSFPLQELAFQPLDVVFGVDAGTNVNVGQPSGSRTYVEELVLFHSKRRTAGFAADASIRLQHARPTDLAPGEITLFDILEQARAVRRTLANARGIRPEDLFPPDHPTAGTVDLNGIERRLIQAENTLNANVKALQALLASATPVTAESIRLALLNLGSFVGRAAVPINTAGEDAASIAALVTQAQAVLRVASPMVATMLAKRSLPAQRDVNARIDQFIDRARAVFGQGFVLLPQMGLTTAAFTEFSTAFNGGKAALGGDVLAANSWFTRYARVRDPLARLGTCLRNAEVLATGEKLNLSVVQLPFVNGERWVGLPPLPGASLPSNKLSLVLQTYTSLQLGQSVSGLLVDEWTEVVPSDHETTALTFQFDPPNAMAPQNILIAVPPVPGVDWNADTLRRVLIETLDLAKIRAIDPEIVTETAQYLPGLYMAFNVNNDAVSTDVMALTQ